MGADSSSTRPETISEQVIADINIKLNEAREVISELRGKLETVKLELPTSGSAEAMPVEPIEPHCRLVGHLIRTKLSVTELNEDLRELLQSIKI